MNCPHCKTNIDEHPASRCLDAWVAEAVMGWFWVSQEELGLTLNKEQPILVHSSVSVPGSDAWWWGREIYSLAPECSTDIAAAWDVFIKVPASDRIISEGWTCALLAKEWIDETADTAPLAICRAAIKACSQRSISAHKPECWKNQALSGLGVDGELASCTCGLDQALEAKST